MKNMIAYTLKSQNYAEIKKALEKVTLPPDIAEQLRIIIRDHDDVTTAVRAAIRKQLKEASGIFAVQRLFEEPSSLPHLSEIDQEQKSDLPLENPVFPDNDEELEKKSKKTERRTPIKKTHALKAEDLKCPSCSKTMHRAHKKSVTIIRIAGLVEENHQIETCRCLSCGTTSEAACAEAQETRIGSFSVDTAAVMCALRYAYGMPSFRLEEVTACLGYRIPDSTQWDLFENCGNVLHRFERFLREEAAKVNVVQMDDTHNNINELTQTFKLMKNGDVKKLERTGVHTTGYIAQFAAGKICLFNSGLHHAGEIFEKLNKARTTEEQVILMIDASSSNTSRLKNMDLNVVQANCNSHAARKFKDLKENPVFEEHVTTIMALYRSVFELDKDLIKRPPSERLMLHQKHSLPKMEKIKYKIEEDFRNKNVEPNSPLGAAYNYYLNHFEKLTAFCKIENAPVCNNACERLLKRAILHRKNSMFFKNLVGAAVGDIHMSILLTAKENGLNPVQYMTALLRYEKHWKENPSDFLPWNFNATLARINAESHQHVLS